MTPTLRQRLRQETGDMHERVEDAFALLDLGERNGIAATLDAHIQVLSRLLAGMASHPDYATADGAGEEYRQEIRRLHDLAVQSRAHFGDAGANASGAIEPFTVHPLSAAYVIFGSRLGSRVIAANMRRNEVDWPKDAIAYFTDDETREYWQSLLCAFGNNEGNADIIVADAVKTFELFLAEARSAHSLIRSS